MGDALEKHTAGLETLAVRETVRELAAAVRFYAELGGQSSQVRPATARVLALPLPHMWCSTCHAGHPYSSWSSRAKLMAASWM